MSQTRERELPTMRTKASFRIAGEALAQKARVKSKYIATRSPAEGSLLVGLKQALRLFARSSTRDSNKALKSDPKFYRVILRDGGARSRDMFGRGSGMPSAQGQEKIRGDVSEEYMRTLDRHAAWVRDNPDKLISHDQAVQEVEDAIRGMKFLNQPHRHRSLDPDS
jgi:hypothetical protein